MIMMRKKRMKRKKRARFLKHNISLLIVFHEKSVFLYVLYVHRSI